MSQYIKRSFAHSSSFSSLFQSFDYFDTVPLSYPIHLDNGRGFGRPHLDDPDVLAPLAQCCLIRPRTLGRLLELYEGPTSLAQVTG